MGLSISVEKVVQILLDRKITKKKQIATYLNSIASDARCLANIWQDILEKIIAPQNFDDNSKRDILRIIGGILDRYGWVNANIVPNYRLRAFYYEISKVVGEKVDSDFHNRFYNHLSSILRLRDITKEHLEESLVPFLPCSFFFDKENNCEKIKEFSQLVEAIQKEAAALEVLAETYKASI